MLIIKEIIKTITDCAKIYNKNLNNRNLIFIYEDKSELKYIETKFISANYLHLTGIKLINNKINANIFYNMCINNKINIKDIKVKNNGTTKLKLEILQMLVNINKKSNIIGNFYSNGINLNTDIIIGNKMSCLGFIKSNNYYVPNTCLKEDVRKLIYNSKKVICILSKKIQENKYKKIDYINKKYINSLLKNIEIIDNKKIEIDFIINSISKYKF